MLKWTFVTNHAAVLSIISRYPMITGQELAQEVRISERAVRRIISELHDGGYITKKKEGRKVRYQVKYDAPLRPKILTGKPVGELLRVLNAPRSDKKKK